MAQVTGGSDFDEIWEERTNTCLALLREAADAYSTRGLEAVEADVVVAGLLWTLSRPLHSGFCKSQPQWPLRFFDEASAPPPPALESCRRLQGQHRVDCAQAVSELTALVQSASASWGLGDPEIPTSRSVLQQLLEALWSRHLSPRPPSRAYPRGA